MEFLCWILKVGFVEKYGLSFRRVERRRIPRGLKQLDSFKLIGMEQVTFAWRSKVCFHSTIVTSLENRVTLSLYVYTYTLAYTDAQINLHTLIVKYYNDLLGRQGSERGRDEVKYFYVGAIFVYTLALSMPIFKKKSSWRILERNS